MQMKLEELFRNETSIPSLPQVFYQFKEAVDDPNASFAELAKIIECEPGLTARLLKIVNSPFFGFQNAVETIPHAISILGNKELSDLVLSTCTLERFKNVSPKAMDMQLFWEHSIACGLVARIIATRLVNDVDPDIVFVGGLLHDIGRLLICLIVPEKFSEVFLRAQTEGTSLLKSEKSILGFGHDEAGGELLRRWNLPKVHEKSVRFHHNPAGASKFSKEASIVNIANSMANSLALGCSGELSVSEIEKESMEILGIKDEEIFSTIREEVQEQYQSTIQVFLENA